MRNLLAVAGLVLSSLCQAQDKLSKEDLNALKALMTGSFSSAEQAKTDTNFFNITLRMEEVAANDKAFWLYVEQAVSNTPDRPYRQRLYRVYQLNDTTAASVIYEFKEPKEFVGAWKTEGGRKSLKDLIETTAGLDSPPALWLRQGCTVYLKKSGSRWWGSTSGNGCASSLRGASYATSEAVITAEGLVTLDRGYSAGGKQVWGSEHGGYKFLRH